MPPSPPILPPPSGALITTMGYLDVPGATLYYETYGHGPITILFVSGGNGSLDAWRQSAKVLATQYNYRVAIYDRRGFSRSHLSSLALQDYSKRLETDGTDVELLLEELAAKGTRRPDKCIVFGTSSGGIVALKHLEMFPDGIADKVIVHEPPLLSILPDREQMIKQQHEVYDMYRAFGIPAAMLLFAQINRMASGPGSLLGPDTRESPYLSNNTQYWFERELMQYPPAELDVEGIAKRSKQKFVLSNGKDTSPDAAMFRAGVLMNERFGVPLVRIAGDHFGYQQKTAEWAADLNEALEGHLAM